MKVHSGKFDIYSSGIVIGIPNESIIFEIEGLIFEIIFQTDNEDLSQRIKTNIPQDESKMVLTLYNHNNSLGTGNIELMKLAHIDSRELLLNYRVYTLSEDSIKEFHYTWYLGDMIKGGINE